MSEVQKSNIDRKDSFAAFQQPTTRDRVGEVGYHAMCAVGYTVVGAGAIGSLAGVACIVFGFGALVIGAFTSPLIFFAGLGLALLGVVIFASGFGTVAVAGRAIDSLGEHSL